MTFEVFLAFCALAAGLLTMLIVVIDQLNQRR